MHAACDLIAGGHFGEVVFGWKEKRGYSGQRVLKWLALALIFVEPDEPVGGGQ